jgi:tetratricopeptide (TPR) repeat protein
MDAARCFAMGTCGRFAFLGVTILAAAVAVTAAVGIAWAQTMSVYGDDTKKAECDDPLCVCLDEKSIEACTRVINDKAWNAPVRAAAFRTRAEAYGTAGRYDLAIRDLDQAIQMVPEPSAVAYNLRGQTYGMKGDYDRAIQDFTQAIQHMPTFAAAYYNRGQTHAAKGLHDLAIKDFSEAISLNSKYALAYEKRGETYYAKKNYSRALSDYSEAIRISPNYADAYNARGTVYAQQGDYDHALNDYSYAIKLAPTSPDFYLSRAMLTAEHADSELVIADLDEAISLDPRRPDFYLLRGAARMGVNDDRAQQDLDVAIKLDPGNLAGIGATAWRLKGRIKYLRGDLAAATQYYDEAVRLDPKSAPNYVYRGLTWAARGEENRAIRDYTQAITLQPDANSAYFDRGIAYFGQGDFVLAAEDFAVPGRDSSELLSVFWRYLAMERAGRKPSKDEIAQSVKGLRPDTWPAPIFQMFQGQRAPDVVLAAAINARQRCEAQFYAGEWQLLQAAREAAAQAFNAAAKSCARTSIEFQVAAKELSRVGDQHEGH